MSSSLQRQTPDLVFGGVPNGILTCHGFSLAGCYNRVCLNTVKTQNGELMSVPVRSEIRAGLRVQIVEKQNQRTGALTEGIVARILTNSPTHPHGIKVMLDNGKVGRVQAILDQL
jgi:uncharacterized repeat protein (TIGR03833 family)